MPADEEAEAVAIIMNDPYLATQRAIGTNISRVHDLGRMEVLFFTDIVKEFAKCRPEEFGLAGPNVSGASFVKFFQDSLNDWDTNFGDVNKPELQEHIFSDSHVHIGHFTENLLISKEKIKAGEVEQTIRARKRGADAYVGIGLNPRFKQLEIDWADKKGHFVNPQFIEVKEGIPTFVDALKLTVKNYASKEETRVISFNRQACVY